MVCHGDTERGPGQNVVRTAAPSKGLRGLLAGGYERASRIGFVTELLDRGRSGTILCQRSPRPYEEVRDRGARTSGTTSSSLRCSRRCSVKVLSEEGPEEMLLLDGTFATAALTRWLPDYSNFV